MRIDYDRFVWQLETLDGEPVRLGDTLTDHRGRTARLAGGSHPRHPGSSGRVWVDGAEYFPSVFNLVWTRYASELN